MRIELTVGTYDSIAVEIVVAGVVFVIVATVGVFYLPQLLVAHGFCLDAHRLLWMAMQCLVDEVPVETALEDGILTHKRPIVAQIATRVAHGVVVLTLYKRLVARRILAVCLAVFHRIIHRAVNIGSITMACLLILHRTALVLTLDPLVSLHEVVAHHGLIAQAPGYDRGMVVEVAHVVLVALHNLSGKHRLSGCGILAILETVTLLVGFCHHIDAILVAEVVPTRIVGIVTGSHGVDVQSFHQAYVLQHALHAYHVSTIRIHLMTVGSLDEYRLTVDQELAVLYFHLAETHLDGCHTGTHVGSFANSRQRNLQGVEIRCFGCPLMRIVYLHRQLSQAILGNPDSCCHLLAVLVEEDEVEGSVALHLGCHLQHAVLVIVHQIGSDANVLKLQMGVTGIEIVLASHTTQTPEVLILAPGTVAPTECLEGYEVLALL